METHKFWGQKIQILGQKIQNLVTKPLKFLREKFPILGGNPQILGEKSRISISKNFKFWVGNSKSRVGKF